MDSIFVKDDPSMFKVLPIEWEENPVDSLSTINLNFETLEDSICNLEYSATNFWEPLYNTYQKNSGKWDSMYSTVVNNSASWQGAYNTVEMFSGNWQSPICIVYPSILPSIDQEVLRAWIDTNFPIVSNGAVNYLEGQQFFIFVTGWDVKIQFKNFTCKKYQTSFSKELRRISCVRYPIAGVNNSYVGACRETVTCSGGGPVKVEERYENKSYGFKYVVEDGVWKYKGDLY